MFFLFRIYNGKKFYFDLKLQNFAHDPISNNFMSFQNKINVDPVHVDSKDRSAF